MPASLTSTADTPYVIGWLISVACSCLTQVLGPYLEVTAGAPGPRCRPPARAPLSLARAQRRPAVGRAASRSTANGLAGWRSSLARSASRPTQTTTVPRPALNPHPSPPLPLAARQLRPAQVTAQAPPALRRTAQPPPRSLPPQAHRRPPRPARPVAQQAHRHPQPPARPAWPAYHPRNAPQPASCLIQCLPN